MRMFDRLRTAAAVVLAPALLGGCLMPDGLYSGVSVGAGNYYDPYDYGYYGRGGYYDPGYGWYDNYYYPGSGYYVYDRAGRRHAMRAQDRAYWLAQREARAERREARREQRVERRQDRVERREARAERRANLDPAVVERRQARREARRSEGGVFNGKARQAIRQAVRGARGGKAPETP